MKKEQLLKIEPRENLTNAISVRVTKNDFKKLAAIAKLKRVTIPALIRYLIKNNINS